ncbi:Polycystin Cation Channel (PCC) Family [Phytophthora palmivora]|uniref:Polycystin Cation Channel (PCC) Family n=1 Tax=Phytophthora palmivora TaxID=4796 RepID=A0A2P4XEV2_9STRA|nr:Polycystin Cation Channel (PCC) Family [Phytophthora palmivora]
MPWTDLYVILSPDPCVEDDKTKTTSPTITVHDALDVLWHDSQHAWDLRRITIALASLAIFVTGLFVHVPTRIMYSQSHAVLTTLATSGDDTVTDDSPVKFSNIEAIPDVLNWLNNTFVPAVFITEDPFNEPLPENEWGRIAMYNQVLGGVSFEVTQMHQHECKTAQFLRSLYGKCYDSEDTTINDFVMPDNYTAMEARRILEGKGDWLNASTKELLITVPTLNSKIPGYVVTTLKFDFKAGGYIKPSFTTTPMLADHYPTTHTIVIDILIVLWFSPWMLMFAIVGFAMKRYKREWQTDVFDKSAQDGIMRMIRKCIFPDGWLAVDILRGPMVHAFYVVVVFTQLKMTDPKFQQEIISLQDGSSSGYEALNPLIDSFKYIARLSVLIRILATAAVFIQGLRVLNTFRNHTGLSLVSRSIGTALRQCGAFSVTFSVIFMAYAVMEKLGLDLQQKIDLLVEKMAKL